MVSMGWECHGHSPTIPYEFVVHRINCVSADDMYDDEDEDDDEDDDAGPSVHGHHHHQPALRCAPQDAAVALNAAAMVRRIREQQKALPTESPTRAMDALAGGSAGG